MKKIPSPNYNLNTLTFKLEESIRGILSGYNQYIPSENQKILEICQLGKMLVTYFPKYSIEEIREQPDFIITNGVNRIAIEHETIVDIATIKHQGFYENIFHLAERDLQNNESLPNFLVNCHIKNNLNFRTKDKEMLVELVKKSIVDCVLHNKCDENKIMYRMHKMPHSHKNIVASFGAYIVKRLDSDTLLTYINKKEKKVDAYRHNTELEQWLLLVSSGAKEYSFEIDEQLDNPIINSKFDKIFLLSDFSNVLFELK